MQRKKYKTKTKCNSKIQHENKSELKDTKYKQRASRSGI